MSRGPSPPGLARRRRLRRAFVRHRRVLVGLLVGAAVTAGLSVVAPASPSLVGVLVAAHDLPGGAALAQGDLTTVRLPPAAVPDGAFSAAAPAPVGRLLATPLRRGEPLTDVHLLGPGLLAGTHGLVAVPLRLTDAGSAALLRPGDLVDVLGVGADDPVGAPIPVSGSAPAAAGAWDGTTPRATTGASTVAAGVRVLAVPETASDHGAAYGGSVDGGVLVVVATTAADARRLAAAEAASRLSVVVLGQETTR